LVIKAILSSTAIIVSSINITGRDSKNSGQVEELAPIFRILYAPTALGFTGLMDR
jgi:hypothetical protein